MIGATDFKVKQSGDTMATNTIASSLDKETRDSSTAGSIRTCSNRES